MKQVIKNQFQLLFMGVTGGIIGYYTGVYLNLNREVFLWIGYILGPPLLALGGEELNIDILKLNEN